MKAQAGKGADLKQRLDNIDQETVAKGKSKLLVLHEIELHGMWRKGREVLTTYPALAKPVKGGGGS